MATQGKDTDVVFLSAARTPFGTFGGALKDLSATQLGTFAARGAI
ncbi:MAG: acetyl-CoA C-acyltransferase, partial [Gemmatimonadota bacterium]|nr:acetyl-CoA C-acyltransferase [Gemmatimonadota bacterium]